MSPRTPPAPAPTGTRSRAARAGLAGPPRRHPRTTAAFTTLTAARREALRADCARLAELDDTEFGVRLLAGTPTHETRDPALLRNWAAAATEFGRELAASAPPAADVPHPARVVETTGGLDRLLLARYTSRPEPTVELFTDTIALGEHLVDVLGWRDRYPTGSLRAAALAHEHAHGLLHHAPAPAGRSATGSAHRPAARPAPRPRPCRRSRRTRRPRLRGRRLRPGPLPLLLTAALMGAVQALGED
ncbi:hypothetical protein ABMX48_12150 [Streptomyces cavourensis]